MSNNKYIRDLKGVQVDVYDVLKAFDVTCPAMQHAAKKVLCAGIRGHKDALKDKREAIQSIERSIELEAPAAPAEPAPTPPAPALPPVDDFKLEQEQDGKPTKRTRKPIDHLKCLTAYFDCQRSSLSLAAAAKQYGVAYSTLHNQFKLIFQARKLHESGKKYSLCPNTNKYVELLYKRQS